VRDVLIPGHLLVGSTIGRLPRLSHTNGTGVQGQALTFGGWLSIVGHWLVARFGSWYGLLPPSHLE